MIKLSKYLSILAISTTCTMAADVDGFSKGLFNAVAQLHEKADPNGSFCVSPLGANLTLRSAATVIKKGEAVLKEVEAHTGASSNPAELGEFVKTLRKDMTIGMYTFAGNTEEIPAEVQANYEKVGSVHFQVDKSDPQGSAALINARIAKDTDGRITSLVTPLDIAQTDFGIISTNHVDKRWGGTFQEKMMDFKTTSGEITSVKALSGKDSVLRLRTADSTLIFIQTRGRGFGLVVKLTDVGVKPSPITYDEVDSLMDKENSVYAKLTLPCVKLTASHDLKSKMVSTLPTFLNGALFSTTVLDTPVRVGFFKQDCDVEWNPQGFIGASATALGMMRGMASMDKAEAITIDRPFTFAFIGYGKDLGLTPIFSGQIGDKSGLVLPS